MATQTAVDIINRAHTRREPDLILDLMADDAELVEYRMDDVANPRVYSGKEQISEVYEDVMSRDMTHSVRDVVATDDAVAWTVDCVYPDGNVVLGSYKADLDQDGNIVRVVGHVSWTG